MASQQPVIWWHFSDLHWDLRSSTERRTFLGALFADLARRGDSLGRPDFIVISGDLSYSGEMEQFDDLERHFIEPLRAVAGGIDPVPILVVPGNHDLRRASTRIVNDRLLEGLTSIATLNDFLDADEVVSMMNGPFSNFEAFSHRLMPTAIPGTLSWTQTMSIRGHVIRVTGASTTWASSYRKDAKGNVGDVQNLLLGERQLAGLRDQSPSRTAFSMLVIHHPLSWIAGFNHPHIKHLINQHADFVLFGHTHTPHDLGVTQSATGAAVYLPAPATYDRQATDSLEFARGYNIVVFDPASRVGNAYYFKYSSVFATKFTPFVELYSGEHNDSFYIDLSTAQKRDPDKARTRGPETLAELEERFPNLRTLSVRLEQLVEKTAIQQHCLDLFDAAIFEIAGAANLAAGEDAHLFWEAYVLCRGLLLLDLQQLADARAARATRYRTRTSVTQLAMCLEEYLPSGSGACELSANQYRALFSLSLDSGSLTLERAAGVSDVYRAVWAFPWLLSRVLLGCDYPELIPNLLMTESRLATLFSGRPADQIAILAFRFNKARFQLTIDLSIQDRDGFFAVTLLKHYTDVVLRQIADLWRQNHSMFPPVGIELNFPRWSNRQIADHYLTVDTTPIVKLLMGRAMYRDAKHVWFRELVQNALDACSARRALDEPGYVSKLEITHHDKACVIRDNGIGMSRQHILRYLTTLGRSIWNSEELQRDNATGREKTIEAIGRFGIGFAAVFQDATRVVVRTRFFRDVGEGGWLVEFSAVDKPFLIESVTFDDGTELEVELREGLSTKAFAQLIKDFFLYIDESVSITPDAGLAKTLQEVPLFPEEFASRAVTREYVTSEQIGPHRFTLRCVFCYDFRSRDKEDRLPVGRLIVANAGVRVFEQPSLYLKPGKRYVWASESDSGNRYEDPVDSGLKHYAVIVDFEKGASPILPSRLEIDIDQEFAKELLETVHGLYCEGLCSVVTEIVQRGTNTKATRKGILTAMTLSTDAPNVSWKSSYEWWAPFSKVAALDAIAVDLYRSHCPVLVETAERSDRFESANLFAQQERGVFVIEHVARSSLFKVYARAAELTEWVVVETWREFWLFEHMVRGRDWRSFDSEKSLYAEGLQVFTEATGSPLTKILRGDYAVIEDDLFEGAAFIVLPSTLPGAWKRSEAAASVRKETFSACPARVLVSSQHPLVLSMETFLSNDSATVDHQQRLKLLVDNLCDGVIEQDRTTVARQRWQSIQKQFGELLGKLPDLRYEKLVVRR